MQVFSAILYKSVLKGNFLIYSKKDFSVGKSVCAFIQCSLLYTIDLFCIL
jgi:hypothetical protein